MRSRKAAALAIDLPPIRHSLRRPRREGEVGLVLKFAECQVAAVVSASGTSDDPQGFGQTVARRLFPDVLPYLAGTRATYGLPPSTAARWPTTHPGQCCPSPPTPPCRQG